MPLFTNSSAAKGSTRRPRGESESRRPTSHRVDSERRRAAKEASSSSSRGSDRRSPPSTKTTNSAAASIYSQPNINQDQNQTPVDMASDNENSPLSPQSPEMRVASAAQSQVGGHQFQLETPLALQQYLDTEDEDATPQPKKEPALPPPTLRRQPALPAASPTPSKQELQSRPLTPEASDAKDDQETVTGSPQHMSMSMPQLRRDTSYDEHYPPPPSPSIHRAFTPPAQQVHQSPVASLAQPMPLYPYAMQDPRAYYAQPLPPQHQHQPQHQSPLQHQLQHQHQHHQHQHQHAPLQPQMQAVNAPPPPGYMYEPRYDEPRYDLPLAPVPPAPRQPMAPSNYYQTSSPDPYMHRHHRLSLASAGGDSQYTTDSADRASRAPGTGRTSPQDHEGHSETSDLLSRISTALPDLQLLLSRCEEVTGIGHSGSAGDGGRGAQKLLTAGTGEDAHMEALLREKELRIEELERERDTERKGWVGERNKLRFEIGNLSELYSGLQDDLVAFKQKNESSGAGAGKGAAAESSSDDAVRRELEASKRKIKEMEESRVVSDRLVASLEAQVRALGAEVEGKKVTETTLQTRLRETVDSHARERETLVAAAAAASAGPGGKGSEALREINEALARDKRELEAAMRAKDNRLEESRKIWMKDIEDARKAGARDADDAKKLAAKEREELQKALAKEKDDLLKLAEEEKAKMRAEAEKEARSVARKHEKAMAELERNLEATFEERFKDLEAELSKARRDYRRVKKDWHVDKERAYEERGKVRAAAARMQAEHAGLMKLLEAFSEPTDRDREREKKEAEREQRDRDRERAS